jgi:diguanylate cyclase (GGDEF)-like protein
MTTDPTADPLTGLGDLTALRLRFTRDAPAVIAVWIDVDGLIWFNDSEGHEAGDAALAAIGRWLLAECEASGLEGYRVAGEEFVLVRPASRPELSLVEASAIADRVVSQSATLDLRFTGPRSPANDRELLTVSALVFRADARLALERKAVCEELALAIFAAGEAARTKYGRRGHRL